LKQKTNINDQNELIKVNIQQWFFRILNYWWLFLICMAIALFIGNQYIKNVTPEYSTNAILLIKDAGNSGGLSEGKILLQEGLAGGSKSMDNEIQIMKSLTIMEKVVKELNAHVTYYTLDGGKEQEIYAESPFVLDTFQLLGDRPFGLSFLLDIKDTSGFELKYTKESIGEFHPFNTGINDETGYYRVSLNPTKKLNPGLYKIGIRPIDGIASSLRNRLRVQRIGSQMSSSVLNLTITDTQPKRARDVINKLIECYNREEVNDKNKVLLSTLDFIDNRVVKLTKELDTVEGGIQKFKSKNSIITDNAASSRGFALGEIRTAVEEISQLEVRKELLASLEKLASSNTDTPELIPANLIADNPVLAGLVNQYNQALLERDRLITIASPNNPAVILIEQQMQDVRALLIQTIQNLQTDLNIPIRKIQRKIDQLQTSVSDVPSIEKALLEQMRTQSIKENLFLYLLQKREETALSEAITAPNTRMVDRARTPRFPIFPQKKMIYIACGLIGLLIPLFIITLVGFFATKIQTEDGIKDLTTVPIIGRIAFSKKGKNIVIKKGNRSAIAEMFRLLRTNLNYLNVKQEKQVLIVTSTISGEGKSFVGLNLAMTMALSNKKVILIGMDMRKPKMHQYLGVENAKGLSNYLIKQSALEEVIMTYLENENLSYITSGPIPPNPAELILSDRMNELINQLKEQYDYIIIDTPPIGLVSDALLMRQYASNIMVVVRQNYTKKGMVRSLEDLYRNKELENVGIVFNAVKMGRRGYGYGGYQYGYGQGYYSEDEA